MCDNNNYNKIIITLKNDTSITELDELIKLLRYSENSYIIKDISMIIEKMKIKGD